MEFEFKEFTQQQFVATEEAWIASCDSYGMPSIEFEKSLEWAKSRLNYETKSNQYAYGVFEKDSDEAVAIIDVTYSTRVKDVGWLKMLEVTFSPSYSEEGEMSAHNFEDKLDIYAEAISGTINLTNHHKAKVVKLYGRNESLLMFLNALNYHIKKDANPAFKSTIEGRWLVLSTH